MCIIIQYFLSLVTVSQTIKKTAAWLSVTTGVNAVAECRRTVDEICRKWRDWSSVVKNKEMKRRNLKKKTRGGGDIITLIPN